MHARIVTVSMIGAAMLLGVPAQAQQPAPAPAAAPAAPPAPLPDYGASITIDQAKVAAAAAITEAKKNNWKMAVAVVGPDGSLIYFEKMDGTQFASVEIAPGKARTSAMYRRPTKVFADAFASGNAYYATFPVVPVASEGGIPIVVGGKLVGGIGVSGGTGQQDGVVANAGLGALK